MSVMLNPDHLFTTMDVIRAAFAGSMDGAFNYHALICWVDSSPSQSSSLHSWIVVLRDSMNAGERILN